MSCVFVILPLKSLAPDPTPNRKQIPPYPRCLHHYIPFRRTSRILSRSSPQPARYSPCRRTISSLRAASCMGPSVPLSYACNFHPSDAGPESTSAGPLTTSTILLCSAISKMTASVATYPHEVVRTRLQIQRRFLPGNGVAGAVIKMKDAKRYKGLVHTARRIVREEGWRGLYKGLSINLFRTVPNSAVTMLTFVFSVFCLEEDNQC